MYNISKNLENMEILPVTNQFNVGFSSEKGESTFYSVSRWAVREPVDFLTGHQLCCYAARAPLTADETFRDYSII